jgi:hypothetical protein
MTEKYNNSIQDDDDDNRNSSFEIKEKFIGIEKDIETFEIARARIGKEAAAAQDEEVEIS